MSHNQGRGSREEDGYDSEDSLEGNQARHEAYVPEEISAPPRYHGTPATAGRQPPVLISNSALMEQLYIMQDAINSFGARLGSVEEEQESRRKSRSIPRNHRRTGKALQIEESSRRDGEVQEKRFQLITPRRLEYSDPIIEHPSEGNSDRRLSDPQERARPHPHRSGRTPSEIQRDEEQMAREKRDFASLKERLGIRLNDDDLRIYLFELQKKDKNLESRPRDPQRAPPDNRLMPLGHERALPQNGNPQRTPPVNDRSRPLGLEQAPHRDNAGRRGSRDNGDRRMDVYRGDGRPRNREGAPSGFRSPRIHQVHSSTSSESRSRTRCKNLDFW